MRFLVTGGQGFFGSYVARRLLLSNTDFLLFDQKEDNNILRQVFLDEKKTSKIPRVFGDVSNFETVSKVVQDFRPTHIIHLAGLQIPTCRVNPVLGGKVNVIGTLNVFEAAKQLGNVHSIVYTSSCGITGPPQDYSQTLEDDTPHVPRTHYGVFKLANEGNARVYWQDHKLKSIGLRPSTVYGVGREIGLTSGPTKAIKAAILGRKFVIPFTGKTSLNYIEDLAELCINCATAKDYDAALHFNIKGDVIDVQDYLSLLQEVIPASRELISVQQDGPRLPVAFDFHQKGLDSLLPGQKFTNLRVGIQKTANAFLELKRLGLLRDNDLE